VRGGGLKAMRVMFVVTLLIITVGLVYFAAVGLLHR
jgi:hypothetical protein